MHKPKQYVHDEGKPAAIIVDIDGTIAHTNIGRPERYQRDPMTDLPVIPVINLIKALNSTGIKVVYLTARSEPLRDVTVDWLNKYIHNENGITDPVELYMRSIEQKDLTDEIMKEQVFYESIDPKYNIVGWFEDKVENIEMARYKLGLLPVFQVGEYVNL